jgi:hypothetical protein
MGVDMMLRAFYLPQDATVDLTAAKSVATRLSRNATLDDLRTLLDNGWLTADPSTDGDVRWARWSDEELAENAASVHVAAEQRLHQLLDAFMASLNHRHAARYAFSRKPNSTDGGIDTYVTGGLSSGDTPTDIYPAWDIVFDTDLFPDGWVDAIGAAAGLLHPDGTGPAARTVTFHTWA